MDRSAENKAIENAKLNGYDVVFVPNIRVTQWVDYSEKLLRTTEETDDEHVSFVPFERLMEHGFAGCTLRIFCKKYCDK
jgi:hypothetical protein